MRTPSAILALAFCALAAGVLPAAGAEPVRIHGLEIEVGEGRERLLVLGGAPLEARLEPVDPRTLMLVLPGTQLDTSAPTRIAPRGRGTVERVTAFERAGAGGEPEVVVVVQRRPGGAPQMQRRAGVVALDFEAPERPHAAVAADPVRVAYRQAPLPQVVTELARATGETVIFDDSLRGSVTVEGPDRMTPGEARMLLDSVLLLRGFAAVPAPGGGLKVVPLAGASGPWSPEGELADSDAPVTTLLRIETATAEDLVEVVRPLLGTQGTAIAYPPTNGLILAGPSSRLARLRTAIEALDDVDSGRSVLWRLHYANAAEVAAQLEELFDDDVLFHASGDERSNLLLLRLREDALERARSLVHRLDRPAEGAGEFQLIRLEHADPEQMAERLRSLREAPSDAAAPAQRSGLQGLDFAVAADRGTHSLVVRAAPEAFRALFDVVRELDQEPPRVRVDVSVAQVTMDDSIALGFDWLLPSITDPDSRDDLIAGFAKRGRGGIQRDATDEVPFVANFTRQPILLNIVDAMGDPIINPITGLPLVLAIPRESFSLTMSRREVRSEVLIRPQLVVVSGEEHVLFAGDNVPVIREQSEPGPALQTRQNVERQDVGTTLRVRPTVGQRGGVFLDLEVETSRLVESLTGNAAAVGPSIGEVTVQSKLWLDDGEVAVIATAGEPQRQEVVTGVPWLGDLPFFGFLFRNVQERGMRRYLLISVEAEILRPERRALARELREKLARSVTTAPSARLD